MLLSHSRDAPATTINILHSYQRMAIRVINRPLLFAKLSSLGLKRAAEMKIVNQLYYTLYFTYFTLYFRFLVVVHFSSVFYRTVKSTE